MNIVKKDLSHLGRNKPKVIPAGSKLKSPDKLLDKVEEENLQDALDEEVQETAEEVAEDAEKEAQSPQSPIKKSFSKHAVEKLDEDIRKAEQDLMAAKKNVGEDPHKEDKADKADKVDKVDKADKADKLENLPKVQVGTTNRADTEKFQALLAATLNLPVRAAVDTIGPDGVIIPAVPGSIRVEPVSITERITLVLAEKDNFFLHLFDKAVNCTEKLYLQKFKILFISTLASLSGFVPEPQEIDQKACLHLFYASLTEESKKLCLEFQEPDFQKNLWNWKTANQGNYKLQQHVIRTKHKYFLEFISLHESLFLQHYRELIRMFQQTFQIFQDFSRKIASKVVPDKGGIPVTVEDAELVPDPDIMGLPQGISALNILQEFLPPMREPILR
jgi:hypothetical protein